MKKIALISAAGILLMVITCKKNDSTGNKQADVKFVYELEVVYKLTWGTYIFDWDLTDTATLEVSVTNGIVTIDKIQNRDGKITPLTQTKVLIDGILICTGSIDITNPVGLMNLSSCTGQVIFNDLKPDTPWLNLQVISNGGWYPKMNYECTNENPAFQGDVIYPEFTHSFHFVLSDELQIKDDSYITATLTPL
jgi:hypothetical protein